MNRLRALFQSALATARGAAKAAGMTQQLLTHAVVWVSGALVGALMVGLLVVSCSGGD
jgi:hypothetical protein